MAGIEEQSRKEIIFGAENEGEQMFRRIALLAVFSLIPAVGTDYIANSTAIAGDISGPAPRPRFSSRLKGTSRPPSPGPCGSGLIVTYYV